MSNAALEGAALLIMLVLSVAYIIYLSIIFFSRS